jgi:cytochrome P450
MMESTWRRLAAGDFLHYLRERSSMVSHGDSVQPPLPGPRYLNPYTVIRTLSDPTDYMLRARDRYGHTYRLPTVLGPVVVTGEPEGVRAIFSADADTFVPYHPDVTAPLVGESSLILASGARHRRDRKLLSPSFHGARMRAYGAVMTESTRSAVAAWTTGTPFKMLDVTQSISLDVILHAVIGLDPTSSQGQAVREAVIRLVGTLRPQFIFFRWMRRDFFGLSAWARFKKAREHLDSLLFETMAERRRAPAERDDILSLMMSARYEDGSAMSDAELRDQLLTLLTAGHETTAVSLAWAFYWLHRDPDELGRLLAELDTLGPSADAEAITSLPYLGAVCQEALRVYPVVPEVLRTLVKPLKLFDWTLPAGSDVVASSIMLHNREDLYPEPTRFRPSRFLEREFTPFEYIPFGGGARRCIGAAFALYEMKIVLATILRSHRLRLVSSSKVSPARRGATMGPSSGIPMLYEGARGVEK